jgi:hypothetical protein
MDNVTAVVMDNGSGTCKVGCELFIMISLLVLTLDLVAGDDAPHVVFPYVRLLDEFNPDIHAFLFI